MEIPLTPELGNIIHSQIQSGRFSSSAEVVGEGLRLLEIREAKLAWLRNEIEAGMNSPMSSGDEAMERIRSGLRDKYGI